MYTMLYMYVRKKGRYNYIHVCILGLDCTYCTVLYAHIHVILHWKRYIVYVTVYAKSRHLVKHFVWRITADFAAHKPYTSS